MTKTELFKKKQAKMPDKELHNLVQSELSRLCETGGKSLTMCMPPMMKDTDMLIGELLNRFKNLTNIDNKMEKELNYLSEKIEEKEQEIVYFEIKILKSENKDLKGIWAECVKGLKVELEILNTILSLVTEQALK